MLRFRAVLLLALVASPALSRPPAGAAVDETIAYRVRRGDTLFDLASAYLDRLQSYQLIKRVNRIADPRRLVPGSLLRVPVRVLRAEALAMQVAAFRNDVRIQREAVALQPAIGMAVGEGAAIETGPGAFITLIAPDGSRVTIPSNSRIRVVAMRRYLMNDAVVIELRVDQGRIDSAVTPDRENKRSFRFQTPSAVSAVRGTRLRVNHDAGDGVSRTEVVEGKVAVGSESAAAELHEGQGALVRPGAAPAVEALLPAPHLIQPARAQKEPLVSFALAPLEGARAYHVQLARDAGFVDLVGDTNGPDPAASFAEIEDGTYFVRVSAVAASGLEGMPEVFSVDRRLVTIGGSAGADGPRGFLFKWVGQGKGKRSYRFQLYADPEALPLVDEAGLGGSEIRLSALPAGTYMWRVGVRQIADGTASENWTELEKITIAAPE